MLKEIQKGLVQRNSFSLEDQKSKARVANVKNECVMGRLYLKFKLFLRRRQTR